MIEWLPAIVGIILFIMAALVCWHAETRYKAADALLIEALKQEHRNRIQEVIENKL